jgi:hypothetical protein
MRSRSTAILSIAAAAVLLLVGCSSTPSPSSTSATDQVVESSYESPAAMSERVGADGSALEVWSSAAPDGAAEAQLDAPEAGTQWVTVNVAQWVSTEGLKDVAAAPVLRSTADESFVGTAVSPRAVEVPMTPEKSYTFAWSFQVPENLVDPGALVLCTGDGDDAACSAIVTS